MDRSVPSDSTTSVLCSRLRGSFVQHDCALWGHLAELDVHADAGRLGRAGVSASGVCCLFARPRQAD